MNSVSQCLPVNASRNNSFPESPSQSPNAGLQFLRQTRLAAAIAATALIMPLPSYAAGTGNMIYQGMTLPAGLVKVGADYWVSDHVSGFCKLIAGSTVSTPGSIDQSSCNRSQVSPGQAAASQPDPITGVTYVYVPDNSSNGTGVWRHTIKDGFIFSSYLLPNKDITGNRPMAVAMGPDNHLYVSLGRNNNIIMRIKNPAPDHDGKLDQTTEPYGSSVVRVGPPAMAFVGNTLYLAENTGLTAIAGSPDVATNALACKLLPAGCKAVAVATGVGAPLFVTSDSTSLYIADVGNAYRFTPSASSSTPGCLKPLSSGYGHVASLAVGPDSTTPASLYVADDPSAGTLPSKGVVYGVDSSSAGNCVLPATAGGTGTTGSGGGVGAPPTSADNSKIALTGPSVNSSLPSGIVQIGSDSWISDKVLGFCKLTPSGPVSCVPGAAVAPGQAVAVPVPVTNLTDIPVTYVYVPDTSSKSLGVWRYTFKGGVFQNAVALAADKLTDARTTAVAYDDVNNQLYVVASKNTIITRINNPDAVSYSACTSPLTAGVRCAEQIGFVSGRSGPKSMTFVKSSLYMAEATAITTILMPNTCSSKVSCTSRAFSQPIGSPVFVTTDGTYLFIADLSSTYRFTFADAAKFTPSAITTLGTGFAPISALGFFKSQIAGAPNPTPNLLVGDDTTSGTTPNTGRVWNLDMTNLVYPMQ
jgi:hypothetical protein